MVIEKMVLYGYLFEGLEVLRNTEVSNGVARLARLSRASELALFGFAGSKDDCHW
jgi:hypothetical protein